MKGAILREKSFAFAVKIVLEMRSVQETRKEYILTRQLLRSGTAVGALLREGFRAESPADFIHKLAIANKEADESLYWIQLMQATDLLDTLKAEEFSSLCEELIRMISASIKTTRQRYPKGKSEE